MITDLITTLQSDIGHKSCYGAELPSEKLETQVTTHSFKLEAAQDEMTEDATDDDLSSVDRKGVNYQECEVLVRIKEKRKREKEMVPGRKSEQVDEDVRGQVEVRRKTRRRVEGCKGESRERCKTVQIFVTVNGFESDHDGDGAE